MINQNKYNSYIKIENRNLFRFKNKSTNKNKYNRKNNINSKIKNNLIRITLILLLILLSSLVFAIPDSLTLQGKLTDLSGSAQQGTFNFTFKIYDSFTEGTALYQIINRSVKTDANGIYDVILYNLSGLNFSDQYYLGIAVQGDNESKPRINLTSSPYSFRANISDLSTPKLSETSKISLFSFFVKVNLISGILIPFFHLFF